jgi:hypothetical protein
MSQTKAEIQPSKDFEAALTQSEPEDFDGHTEFHRLTARATAGMALPGRDGCL